MLELTKTPRVGNCIDADLANLAEREVDGDGPRRRSQHPDVLANSPTAEISALGLFTKHMAISP